jgi:DNA ligase-1
LDTEKKIVLGKRAAAVTVTKASSGKKQKVDDVIGAAASTKGAQPLMLAKNFDPVTNDPTGWIMSEKLDGVRCFWNGRNMYTRNGNLFYPPAWWKDLLPKNLALDGELWTERDDFQKTVSIVRSQKKDEEWK